MAYLGEFRANWRAVIAGAVGLGCGIALYYYSLALFVPALMAEFKWTKEQYALIGLTAGLAFFTLPVGGRIVDLIGVRRTAMIGVIGMPIGFLLFSLMTGDIYQYFAITCFVLIVGALTTASIYSRLVVGCFAEARGLALALVISGPATIAALGTRPLSGVIQDYGWRTGFHILAVFSLLCGIIALLLAPRIVNSAPKSTKSLKQRFFEDYPVIFRQRAFWLIIGGMVLCNVPQVLISYHMTLILAENGATAMTAASILSVFAASVIVGRFICGFSLDRFPAHIVATIGMAIPAFGLFILASSVDTTPALFVAVALMGLSQGAEGDLGAYLVARHFALKVFGSVFGLIICSLSAITLITTVILSRMLGLTGTYALYIAISGVCVLAGSLLFLLLGSSRKWQEEGEPELQPASLIA